MKFLVYSFLLFTYSFHFMGCSSGKEMSQIMIITGYDFTKYTKLGFLFTPEKYNGDYESIAYIKLSIYPSVKKMSYDEFLKTDSSNTSDKWKSNKGYKWKIDKIPTSEILDSLYNYSKNKGADAVTNLDIEPTEAISNGKIFYSGIKASGFAIKRK